MTDAATPAARRDDLIPDGAELERVATGATWSEGPLWLPLQKVVRWSDITNNRILEFDPATGETRTHRDEAEFTNGRTLDLEGRVIQCSHGRRAVEREVDGEVTVLVDRWRGARFNSPNVVVVKSDGTIWFTDPSYGITKPEEGHAGELEYEDHYVFRFDPSSGDVEPVIIDIDTPNGLAFSVDEATLYVSDTAGGDRHIRAYDVVDGRRCKDGRLFASVDSGVVDGFRIDEHDNLWASSDGAVVVFDPDGEVITEIPVPETVANLCFGGDDGQDLYITASTSLYRIRTGVRDATRARMTVAVGTPVNVPIVVMGVSGSGKTTVGQGIADELGIEFVDGDTLHPKANKEKMAAGRPLDDADRLPWLSAVGGVLAEVDAVGRSAVVACSALKRSYRDLLRDSAPHAVFVQLDGSRAVLEARLAPRRHEYMPATLLESQLSTLEPLQPDEAGIVVDIDAAPAVVAANAVDALRRLAADAR